MRLFRGTISTNVVGSGCVFEVEIDESITDEDEIEEICREEALNWIDWEYHEVRDDGLVSGRKEEMLNELKQKYPDVKFEFNEEVDSLQLLHKCYELVNNNDFFDTICDIALKYLSKEEQSVFCPLYDYLGELEDDAL